MANYEAVTVNITRQTGAITTQGYGTIFILTTQSTNEYKEYSDMAAVTVDYAVGTEAYKMAAAAFSQNPSPSKVAIAGVALTSDFSEVITGLDSIFATYSDWSYLVVNTDDPVNIALLSAWADANKRLYIASVSVENYEALNLNSDYTAVIVYDNTEAYPTAGWPAMVSQYPQGSATWSWKTVNGLTPQSFVDQATSVQAIIAKNFNTYIRTHSINVMVDGQVTSGEWIDIILGIQWIEADLRTRITRLLATTPKIPYDTSGIDQILSQVEATLRQATEYQIIRSGDGNVGEYTIEAPRMSEIDRNDIANRILRNVRFTAYLAGAIHQVQVTGVVLY